MKAFGDRSRRMIPWAWTGLVFAAALPVFIAAGYQGLLNPEVILQAVFALLYAPLGLVVALRQPRNGVAWILLLIATGIILTGASEVALVEPASSASVWRVLATIWQNSGYFVAFILPLLLLLYLFPTGHFLTRRWSWAGWAIGAASFVVIFAEGFASEIRIEGETTTIANPFGFHTLGGSGDGAFSLVLGVCLLALIAGAPVAVVVRFRRSSTLIRSQIKLVVVAMGFTPLFILTGTLMADSWVNTVTFLGAIIAMPVAITVAIVRHSLFDIDVVISRSLTFGVLAVFIGGVYVGIVVGLGELMGGADESSFGLSVAATAVVAIAFQPVRSRVESWANRLVFGKRATPYEVLARFSHRAVDESDQVVLDRIPRLIVDGTGVAEAALWVRSGGGFETVSLWPAAGTRRTTDDVSVFMDPDADVSLPVLHDGELLGGISLVNARGASISPPERELLDHLADGLGLTLRNNLLTASLRRQVKDLRRSRDRVVSAADDARRALEHDLDSGPQQQLVAVKVKLGPLRKLAEQAGAERTAAVLADIESQAGDAIQAVRDFAAGIYPPLLGAEGLAVALGQEIHKAAIPVDLSTDGVGRYPRDIESAVYFSILEALQNIAKYAEASRAVVHLSESNGDLAFEIIDDGIGFDTATVRHGVGLNGIGDRIDTVGGSWTVASTPGAGTVVSGLVPVKDAVRA